MFEEKNEELVFQEENQLNEENEGVIQEENLTNESVVDVIQDGSLVNEMKDEKKINTGAAKEKIVEVKEKIGKVTDKIKEKFESKNFPKEQLKPLVTSRILFISVLDKILIILLLITLLGATYFNFISSYPVFRAILFNEVKILICIVIEYLFLNWLYKCAVKTMLCLTNNEVYLEFYAPFINNETSIPLNKITGVTTINFFWIFRTIIIHQYGKLPLVFCTWNNHEFKDKLNELITTDKGKVENEYQNRNILSKNSLKFLKYLGIVLGAVMILVGIVCGIKYITSPARTIPGTYVYDDEKIEFKSNGKCNIDSLEDNVTKCNWKYEDKTDSVRVDYTYKYYSYYYGSTTLTDYLTLKYNKDSKTLTYSGDIYTKQK